MKLKDAIYFFSEIEVNGKTYHNMYGRISNLNYNVQSSVGEIALDLSETDNFQIKKYFGVTIEWSEDFSEPKELQNMVYYFIGNTPNATLIK